LELEAEPTSVKATRMFREWCTDLIRADCMIDIVQPSRRAYLRQ
jgi:hypothetical protein